MPQKLRYFLIISLLLHSSVLLFFIKLKSKPVKTEFFEIKAVETKRAKTKLAKGTGKGSVGLPKISDLMPTLGSDTKYGLFKTGDGNEDNPLSDWGSGSNELKRMEQLSLMLKVYNQMQNLLYYPAILAHHRISGNVNARLVLNEVGSCDWHRTQISSSQAYLKVFVLDLLKDLCTQHWEREVAGRKLTNLDLAFQFELSEHDDWKYKKEQSRIAGNVLFFYTNAQRSVLEWNLGPFNGIFPIPAINLDFQWLKENWEKVIEKKDPLREFKSS